MWATQKAAAASTQTPQVVQTSPQPEGSSGGGHSSLEACIIHNESGGSPTAANGQYHGIGQWSQEQWSADGGHGSPEGASLAEQESVLRSEGSAGQIQQQGQYDGCG